jgi:cysteine desulfurase
MIYLDHNATTPLDERVLEVMLPYLSRFYGNASNLYRLGRAARAAVDTAREQVAALVGAAPSAVTFTSGGTEANNLAIKGLGFALEAGSVAVGATEHPAVAAPVEFLKSTGWRVETLGAAPDGTIHADQFDRFRPGDIGFDSVMWANNETGAVSDIPALAAAVRSLGGLLHCDAVQAAGKVPLDFRASGVQLLSLSAHKLFGPKGAGALIADPSVSLVPLLHGGGQERGLRGGTENVPAIVGFGKAAELALAELDQRHAHALGLRQRLERGLRALPGAVLFAEQAAQRLPNTVEFALGGYDGEMMVMMLDR